MFGGCVWEEIALGARADVGSSPKPVTGSKNALKKKHNPYLVPISHTELSILSVLTISVNVSSFTRFL
jgi:hypothetical protein